MASFSLRTSVELSNEQREPPFLIYHHWPKYFVLVLIGIGISDAFTWLCGVQWGFLVHYALDGTYKHRSGFIRGVPVQEAPITVAEGREASK